MTTAEPTTAPPTLAQALDLVRRLPLAERAELVAQVVRELAHHPPARRRMTPEEARAAIIEIRAAFNALPQPRLTIGEQLEADRRDRDRTLLGRFADKATAVAKVTTPEP